MACNAVLKTINNFVSAKSKTPMQAYGHQISSDASIGVLDPRGSRQMDMPACPLGSLLAGIKGTPLRMFPNYFIYYKFSSISLRHFPTKLHVTGNIYYIIPPA